MQINRLFDSQIIESKQDFKGNPVTSSTTPGSQNYQPIPLEASKAYVSPQITQGYREIQTFDIPYIGKGTVYELANGHKVVIVPKAGKTYISTKVGVGFTDEPADKKNIAHLTEHLVANYWNNATQTSDIAKTLNQIGADSNAATDNCNTSYHMAANVQDDADLDNLIKIQLGTLTNKGFSEDEIEKEKNIVIEELTENKYLTKDEIKIRNQTSKNLFNLDDSNGIVSETTPEKINNIKKEDLENFYNNYYRPDNMTTFIVGNVDDNSIKIVSKYLNKMTNPKNQIKRKNLSNINENTQINQAKRTDLESKDKTNEFRNFMELSFIGPKVNNQKDTENLLVLNKILENRLKQQNIDIDTGIPSMSIARNIPQFISITGGSFEEDTEQNLKIINATIDNLAKNPVSKEELDEARKQVLEVFLDNLEDNSFLANSLDDALLADSKMNIKNSFEHLKNISLNDIQTTAQTYLNLNKASLVVIHPQKTDAIKTKDVSFKGLAELKDTKNIKEYDLPNNLHVIFDTRPGIVKTSVSCHFSFEDKDRNNGGIIDAMQSSLVKNENDKWPSGSWVELDGISINKNSSVENIQDMISEIKKELISPEFKANELEESKKYQKKEFSKEKKISSASLLERTNLQRKENGICPDWVTTSELKLYYNSLLKHSQGNIIISIPKEKLDQVEPEILKALSELPSVKPRDFSKISSQYTPKDLDKNSIFLTKKATSDNVEVKKEFKIIHNGNLKDEAGIILLNSILSSNLNKSLREDLGLTYGASSNFEQYSSKHGTLTIFTNIAKQPLQDNTKTAINQIDRLINDLINSKIDETILNNAKKQLRANLLIPAETSVDRNSKLNDNDRISYDINHSQKLTEAIDNMTPDDLQKLAQQFLTKNYLLELKGNDKAIERNKDYFLSQGEIISCD